jgi:hypothetical protein
MTYTAMVMCELKTCVLHRPQIFLRLWCPGLEAQYLILRNNSEEVQGEAPLGEVVVVNELEAEVVLVIGD